MPLRNGHSFNSSNGSTRFFYHLSFCKSSDDINFAWLAINIYILVFCCPQERYYVGRGLYERTIDYVRPVFSVFSLPVCCWVWSLLFVPECFVSNVLKLLWMNSFIETHRLTFSLLVIIFLNWPSLLSSLDVEFNLLKHL